MSSIKKKLTSWKRSVCGWLYSNVLPWYDRWKANRLIKRLNRRKPMQDCPIKVGFVVQMPEVWNKQAPVYEEMVRDPRFDPWLIVVPSYNLTTRRREGYGAELVYFRKSYPDGQILTSDDLGEDFSGLQTRGFHYIFLSRCWEAYIPDALRTRSVLQYAKTCYIPYAYHSFEDEPSYYGTRFFYYLSTLFCCSKTQLEQYCPSGKRKSVLLGFPPLSKLQTTEISDYRRLRFVWTPRWTNDPEYGGTSFLDYKDRFIELRKTFPEMQILLRPHPLTFDHMVNCGHMTTEEVVEYKLRNENAGVHFDQNADFGVTLKQIDGIITDFSSIVIEALMCGKIIIFCGREPKATPSETLREILKCSYVCKNWEEIVATLKMLSNHVDPLLSARETLADKLHRVHENCSKGIVEWIVSDR